MRSGWESRNTRPQGTLSASSAGASSNLTSDRTTTAGAYGDADSLAVKPRRHIIAGSCCRGFSQVAERPSRGKDIARPRWRCPCRKRLATRRSGNAGFQRISWRTDRPVVDAFSQRRVCSWDAMVADRAIMTDVRAIVIGLWSCEVSARTRSRTVS